MFRIKCQYFCFTFFIFFILLWNVFGTHISSHLVDGYSNSTLNPPSQPQPVPGEDPDVTAARVSVYDPPSYEEAMLMDRMTQDDAAERADSGSDEEGDDDFQRELQSKVRTSRFQVLRNTFTRGAEGSPELRE